MTLPIEGVSRDRSGLELVEDGRMFIRFQSPTPGKRGVYTGIFGLMNGLGRGHQLTAEEHRIWRSGNDWFNAAYPDPSASDPTVYDETLNPRATAWFKHTAEHLLARVPPYLRILDDHGVPWVRIESEDPGHRIYEDDVQIVVNPYDPASRASLHADDAQPGIVL